MSFDMNDGKSDGGFSSAQEDDSPREKRDSDMGGISKPNKFAQEMVKAMTKYAADLNKLKT